MRARLEPSRPDPPVLLAPQPFPTSLSLSLSPLPLFSSYTHSLSLSLFPSAGSHDGHCPALTTPRPTSDSLLFLVPSLALYSLASSLTRLLRWTLSLSFSLVRRSSPLLSLCRPLSTRFSSFLTPFTSRSLVAPPPGNIPSSRSVHLCVTLVGEGEDWAAAKTSERPRGPAARLVPCVLVLQFPASTLTAASVRPE